MVLTIGNTQDTGRYYNAGVCIVNVVDIVSCVRGCVGYVGSLSVVVYAGRRVHLNITHTRIDDNVSIWKQ